MNTPSSRFTFVMLASALGMFFITGCNTVRGVGRDVQHVGNHIERATR